MLPLNYLCNEESELANKISPPILISNVTDYFTLKTDFVPVVDTEGFTVTTKSVFPNYQNSLLCYLL